MLLEALGLAKRFGGVHAVADVDLAVGDRQVIGLFGPNGAGKTTLVNLISGHLRADAGAIRLAVKACGARQRAALPGRAPARAAQRLRLRAGRDAFGDAVRWRRSGERPG